MLAQKNMLSPQQLNDTQYYYAFSRWLTTVVLFLDTTSTSGTYSASNPGGTWGWKVKLPTHLHIIPMLIMHGACLNTPNKSSSCAKLKVQEEFNITMILLAAEVGKYCGSIRNSQHLLQKH